MDEKLLLISAIISFLSLDITIAFQMLISSPIFSCTLLGWLLGDIQTGMELGFVFQLLWLGKIPAGAYIVPEGNIASMMATVLILINKETGWAHTTLAVVFIEVLVLSYLGSILTLYYRKFNGKILDLMLEEVKKTRVSIMVLLELASMVVYFLAVMIFSLLALKLSQFFLPSLITLLGPFFESQLVMVKPVIIGIGLASIYPILKEAFSRSAGNKIETN